MKGCKTSQESGKYTLNQSNQKTLRIKKFRRAYSPAERWLRGKDLNLRPSGYEPDELPTAPPRDENKTSLRSERVLLYHDILRCQQEI